MASDVDLIELSVPVTERDHVRGSLDAPNVIVEYGDYECPDCGRAYWVVKELLEDLGDQVAFVFRNFPLVDLHPRADSVAEALEAAAAQGRFWEMHDWFYEHQHSLESLDLDGHARSIGLDVELWRKNLREASFKERVREDLETGRASGVHGTPTFFINGTRYTGKLDRRSMLAATRR
ncbi:MAG: hypothetical protein QOH90_565 [Actinomycetota bacterium]|nr:hypothetical protein [Actinomycetota bacterium]